VGVVARILGQLWSSLGENDKAIYQQRAAKERERVSKQVEKYMGSLPEVDDPIKSPTVTLLPSARIRKICKLDPEVKGLSKEALQLITKCAELMTVKLGTETQKVAQLQNRRTILPDDVAHVCANREQFLFLREDIRDLYQEQVSHKAPSTKARPQAPLAGKPLTDYFQHQK
jgi:DNA-directed RNA polymerase I subunit RPA43